MESKTNSTIKGYTLTERIGQGGFGEVYKARQKLVERDVAIKIIKPSFASQPDFVRRFEKEAQLIARLEHPFIVPLYDFWRDHDGAYLVMRYLRGGNLRHALREGAYELDATVRMIEQIASALATAHRNNIIHRDLKPENILLDEDGNHYLADFGIAKDNTIKQGNHTSLDQIRGTPDYLSPEQGRNEPITPRTDVYSLGVVLYEILTGEHPFPNLSGVERLFKHLNDPLPLIENRQFSNLDGINEVIQQATAKNPADRYEDVLALVVALRHIAELGQPEQPANLVELFTPREQEVLQHMIAGKSNREIAGLLFITVDTVRWYLKQLYKKLRVRNRVQAIARARELDLVFAPDDQTSVTVAGNLDSPATYLMNVNNPYKGLHAFQASDAQDFFGREKITEKLIARLAESDQLSRFLAIVGPSGSGKSSLVKAGLIPALWQGKLSGSDRWFIAELMPGNRPLDELEVALMRIAANQGGNLHEQLTRDSNGLLRVAQLILPDDGSELVIVIDQFEEVFTLVEDEAERQHFLNLLHAAVTGSRSRVRVVITLRADFYGHPLAYQDFGELVRDRMETILPLSAQELESAIVNPAKRIGMAFEEGLPATIASEVLYQPGALPLLQYALTELCDQRAGNTLTHQGYLQIGGTVGALAKRAEGMFNDFSDDAQEFVRQVFLRLVTLGEGVEDTRRRIPRSELDSISDDPDLLSEFMDVFASARLISMDHDPFTREPTLELAHESILREWERLRGWIDTSRDDIRRQRQLTSLTNEWLMAAKDQSFLLRGSRLTQFSEWMSQTEIVIAQAEQDFLSASIAAHQRQAQEAEQRQMREAALERRAIRRLRWLVAVFAGATGIAIVLSILLGVAFNAAQQQRNNAEQQRRVAVSRELAAAAITNLDVDPERSMLLALHGLAEAETREAENALHQAFANLHIEHTLTEHTARVRRIAYSPDGQLFATASWDGTAIIWNAETNHALLTLSAHAGPVQDVAFSPDGTQLVTGGADGLAFTWDVANGEQLLTLAGHSNQTVAFHQGVVTVQYAPDGSLIATGGTDGSVRVWDAETGEQVREIQGDAAVLSVDFSLDGQQLVTGNWNGLAVIWEVSSGEEIMPLTPSQEIVSITYSPDGTMVAGSAGSEGVARIWDAESGEELLTLRGHEGVLDGIAFSPDSQRIATASWDGSVRVWDANTGQELLRLDGHSGNVDGVAFHPDGIQLASASSDSTVRIWNTAPSYELFTITAGIFGPPTMMSLSPDGSLLATGQFLDGPTEVRLWDAHTGTHLRSLEIPENVNADDTIREVQNLSFSPDGTYLAAATSVGEVYLWTVDSGTHTRTFAGHTGWVWGLDFSPDGLRLVSAGEDATAKVWDVQSGEVLMTFEGHASFVWSANFNPDGTRIVTASRDNSTKVWDATTGAELLTWQDEGGFGNWDARYSPDGTRILVGRENGSSVILDATSGGLLQIFSGHTGVTIRNTFNPSATWVATANFDGTSKIWNVGTGEELLTLTGHTNNVVNVVFSPDGNTLFTSSFDGTIRGYVLDLDNLTALAQSRLTRTFTVEECQQYLHQDACPK